MDLIIVDQNISYTKSLREFCLKSSKFKNVIIFRTLKELIETYIPQKGILLFECTDANESNLEKFNSKNTDLTIIALSNQIINNNSNLIEKGVSTIISKNEKLETILEQINLVIKGNRILPKEMFESIKKAAVENNRNKKTTIFQKFNKTISKIFK